MTKQAEEILETDALDEGAADAAAVLNEGRDANLRGWVVPAIIGSALLMQTLNATSINNALPSMARAVHVEPLRLNLAITMYLLASAVFLPISGWMADRFGATPFDIDLPGVHWSHRGEQCTFDVMVEEFGLETDALKRLALIVRGADTGRPELAPESAGLLAASLGLSRMYADDLAQLEAGMTLYDSFYRWCRDATDEGHDWPPTARKAAGKKS